MRASWPFTLHWRSAAPRFVGQVIQRQQAISGAESIVPSMAGRWEVAGKFVVHGEAAELAYQAFVAQMEGGVGTTLVPIWSRYRPTDRDGHPTAWDNMAMLGGAQTWEHFGFANAPVATMTLAAEAPLRATTISVAPGNTTGIRPGQYFSLGERLYRVQHHWQDASGTSNLMIQPPLRAAAAAGTPMVLDRPVCLMRMAEEAGELEYTPEGVAFPELTFVEAI